ncbi:MAG: UDP-N-acetylmuramoyl-L-alanine--D-glutamate ligase [Spirochaetes bacterium]|nr:UDP-N-acetylmuramoyl-L-alanine--D-glutamate ligase [Spirochaetota bacterium]MBN2772162.1 UDP-N-acetylmuramoyl-L-alanine--D-glutamate ligase [Spirochaetota bacterium]
MDYRDYPCAYWDLDIKNSIGIIVKIDIDKKGKVLVVGLGFRTGLTSANFLSQRGYKVTVSDNKSVAELTEIIKKLDKNVDVVVGKQSPEILDENFDFLVLSPGVPASIPLIVEANKRALPVISEVELAYYFMSGKWIAITGTDGKSTTTSLTNHILRTIGYDSREGGNIGVPLISLVEKSKDDSVTVAELSSFQLETVFDFHPGIATLLNLAPDHLDRYDSMDHYLQAKLRIGMNMGSSDYLVYNLDDEVIAYSAQQINAKGLSFSINDCNADCFYDGQTIFLKDENSKVKIDPSNLLIRGIHNIKNFMASLLMIQSYIRLVGDDPDYNTILKAACDYPGLEHRLEYVATIDGVTYINDSKATTVNSVKTAIAACGKDTVFIVGGRAKGENYGLLAEALRTGVRHSVLIGETADEFEILFSHISHERAASMEEAVKKAKDFARSGDSVVLSPGCASFDMYRDFEERGRDFKRCVAEL